jgi:hypothetical protein
VGESQSHVLEIVIQSFDQGAELGAEPTVDFLDGGGGLALNAEVLSDLLGELLVENSQGVLDFFGNDIFVEEFFELLGETAFEHSGGGLKSLLGVFEFGKGF